MCHDDRRRTDATEVAGSADLRQAPSRRCRSRIVRVTRMGKTPVSRTSGARAKDRQQGFVLRTLEERDIRFVRLWFTDVLGTLKSVSVAPAELESAFEEGMGIGGPPLEGFARVYEPDMVAMPDPTTFQVFPFEGGASGESARMFCDS